MLTTDNATHLGSERSNEDLLKKIEELKKQNEELSTQNLLKRTEKEISEIKNVANERTVKKVIELKETVEHAIQMVKEKADASVLKGFELISAKIDEILKSEGVAEVESVGKKFDPYYHEVVQVVESDEPDGTIIEEVRKGYTLNGRVIRPSMVKVSKKRGG
ncbi:nucleotide exchange factor GrpE [Candidatus Marsarchaeota G2 archaeon ECH_B_SAG-F08]|uniref:Protein GrpE n=1 Tax=Candidatus Marsarchaeota G2 archaeon ECH_B_SAG-F08 TaxID=1978165 RepID=A0A2R6BQ94_9ARCH|nr:MAG: nucleotide exchange factor GrpE [Candidatus Marsarchaeota G2 archaeon ECH_B_SAG-F08]